MLYFTVIVAQYFENYLSQLNYSIRGNFRTANSQYFKVFILTLNISNSNIGFLRIEGSNGSNGKKKKTL